MVRGGAALAFARVIVVRLRGGVFIQVRMVRVGLAGRFSERRANIILAINCIKRVTKRDRYTVKIRVSRIVARNVARLVLSRILVMIRNWLLNVLRLVMIGIWL